ncbi:MAG: endonuclease III [Nitrospirae bacterium]|nr:endonuclease III [Nitrospirota bacterium]
MEKRVKKIFALLDKKIPDARTELRSANPLELLVATILSAQCTDERVNRVTERLFKKYKSAADYAKAELTELEEDVRPTGFYKNKARALKEMGGALCERFGGKVPDNMEDLTTLPGVGRKTANVILGNCFGQPAIVVDTHVRRVSQRLDLVDSDNPEKIEFKLMEMIDKKQWTSASHQLLLHGRYVCTAKNPKCPECVINNICQWEGKRI